MNNSLSTSFHGREPFSIKDLHAFERCNSRLLEQIRHWNVSQAIQQEMNILFSQKGKPRNCIMLAVAKYAPENMLAKSQMIKHISNAIDHAYDKLQPSERDLLVDAVSEYLPLHEKPYKDLRDTIKAWQLSDGAWRHARAQSRLEL